ncbi:sodium:solute symporter family protein [Sphingomonas citri]
MIAAAVTVVVVAATMLGTVAYGRMQARARTISEWAIGGRSLGLLVFWFLNAGEIYTTFAVLGISGYAWAHGAPATLALCSVSLAAAIGYWLTPRIWRSGRASGLMTQADFFSHHYRSRWLGILVALVGIAALVIYVQIQITALGLVLRVTLGDVDPAAAAALAAAAMLLFVFFAGLRSAAFAAGVKDVLMVLLVGGLALTVAREVGASSIADLFRRAEALAPAAATLPGRDPAAGLGVTWLMTTAISVAVGTYIFPHMFQLCYAADAAKTLRRNAIFQPLYSLSYLFIILLGVAALVAGTRPPAGDANAVLLQLVTDRYPAWVTGLFGGTAALLALVPGSVLLLTIGTIFTRNVVLPLRPVLDERAQLLASRAAMVAFAALAAWLSVGPNQSLVTIGLTAYATIGMLAPGVYLAFLRPGVPAVALGAGLAVGYAAMLLPSPLSAWAAATGFDLGLAALLLNGATVLVLDTALRRGRAPLAVA